MISFVASFPLLTREMTLSSLLNFKSPFSLLNWSLAWEQEDGKKKEKGNQFCRRQNGINSLQINILA